MTQISDIQAYLNDAAVFAFDFETSPDEPYRNEEKAALDPHKSHIVGISLSIAEGSGIYVPLTHKVGKNVSSPTKLWAYLAELFANPKVIKIAHNLAFESMFLYGRGIVVQAPVYDTIAASQPFRRFCCDACRLAWWKAHPKQVNRKAIYKYICPVCHKAFTAYGNNHRIYCSRKCYGKSRVKASRAGLAVAK
ncbi:MAG: hypothetical protein LBN05_02285 [Oscillospiraceae bacterium]|jgi:hypothetical protein|nr:hypothetical protein [Oscillospiraceae bacterium]